MFSNLKTTSRGGLCFNRYMVECEFYTRKTHFFYMENVLIDTWWNVNFSSNQASSLPLTVLIDTWWNVNHLRLSRERGCIFVLIDTWWNVNFLDTAKDSTFTSF